MANYLFIADSGNNRIVILDADVLTFISEFGAFGSGDNEFNNPIALVCDDTFIYIYDYGNSRIVKRNALDLSYIFQVSINLDGSLCSLGTNGTYLYAADANNSRVVKLLCSDLSTVSFITDSFITPLNSSIDDTYLYSYDFDNGAFMKHLLADSSFIISLSYTPTSGVLGGLVTNMSESNIYTVRGNNTNNYVQKRLKSNLSLVAEYGSADQTKLYSPRGITYDGTYLYVINLLNGDDGFVSKIRSSDMSFSAGAGNPSISGLSPNLSSPQGIAYFSPLVPPVISTNSFANIVW